MEYTTCDVAILEKGDVIHYHNIDRGKFIIDVGTLNGDNIYDEGVQVHGEDWKQYVSKYFINKVERNGEIIFEQTKI